MKCFFIIVFTMLVNVSFAQVEKAYILKNGKFSDNPKNAISYVIIEKLAGDSAYSAVQYDMRDTILFSGFYKDELLSIPNGKFIYYQKNKVEKKRHGNSPLNSQPIDTNNFISGKGYIINGKRTGLWTQYYSDGRIDVQYTYENDILNGPFRHFIYGDKLYRSEGTMVNGQQEGKFLLYGPDSLLIAESNYFHGRDTLRIIHWHEARDSSSFDNFMEKRLKKYRKEIVAAEPLVKFVVNKNGKIINPQIVKGINPEIDSAVISAMAVAPAVVPATYDGIPVEQMLKRRLSLFWDRGFSQSGVGADIRYVAPPTIRTVYYISGGHVVGAGLPTH